MLLFFPQLAVSTATRLMLWENSSSAARNGAPATRPAMSSASSGALCPISSKCFSSMGDESSSWGESDIRESSDDDDNDDNFNDVIMIMALIVMAMRTIVVMIMVIIIAITRIVIMIRSV